MTTDRRAFKTWNTIPTGVKVGESRMLRSPGRGDIEVIVNGQQRVLTDVLYVPQLGYNLLSISALEKHGFRINFWKGIVEISRDGTSVAVGKRAKNLYYLDRIFSDIALVSSEKDQMKDIENRESGVVREGVLSEVDGDEGESDVEEVIRDIEESIEQAHK